MSSEEDTELRDLVAQTLEINGCLPKIRAELRASIFLALDEDDEVQKQEPLLNKKVKTQLESQEGRTMFCLVREFLEFFDLDFTISVYEPESYLGKGYHYEGRSKIIEDLGISQLKENSTLPLLLQLIQIARLKNTPQTKNIDINLSKIQNEGRTEEEPSNSSTHNEDSNKAKTEVSETQFKSATSFLENLDGLEVSHSSNENSLNGVLNPATEIHAASKEANLNATFDVISPSINFNESKKSEKLDKPKPSMEIILSPRLIDSSKSGSEEKDDTFDGTSSIAEDSVKDSSQLDVDKITSNSEKSHSQSPSETEFSPPILKDSKSHSKFDVSFDKLKLSPQKTEKLKAKSSLSSLADLPPLQLNKSRNDTVLLPSLYSKEFKEKTANQNLRELDKFFDVDVDNYEEDFMSESEINLNSSRNNLLDELQSASITDSNKNVSVKSAESKNTTYSGKSLFLQNAQKSEPINKEKSADANQNLEKSKTEALSPKNTNGVDTRDNSGTSSVISDELNLHVDDILNSPTSN